MSVKPYSRAKTSRCIGGNVIADKSIVHSRTNTTFVDRRKTITYLIDISVTNALNIGKGHNVKEENYQPLTDKVNSVWQEDKLIVVPVIISATTGVPKNIHKNTEHL
jgi:hypothetical protein